MPSYTFTNIDVPGSSIVEPRSINDAGDVVGFYIDPYGRQYGFADENGVITTIAVPGATSTSAADINASGEIVGTSNSSDANIGYQGFTDIDGNLQAIIIPNSVNLSATSVNDAGQVAGYYDDTTTNKERAFIYKNGQYVSIDAPGASATFAWMINNAGEVAGFEQTPDGNGNQLDRYFLYNGGDLEFIAVPGAKAGTTTIQGLNDLGEVTGAVNDGASHYGYVENNGTYTTFGVPGATYFNTSGINDAGVVTGYYDDAASQAHMFLEKDGIVTLVAGSQLPNAVPDAINDAGELVGNSDSNDIITGFTATPTAPAIAGTVAGQTTTGTDPIAAFAKATITDPNDGTETLTISLSGGGGTLTGTGLTANTNGTYTLTGPATGVTSELEALMFTPTAAAPGTSATTTFALVDTSSASPTAARDDQTSVIDTVASGNPGGTGATGATGTSGGTGAAGGSGTTGGTGTPGGMGATGGLGTTGGSSNPGGPGATGGAGSPAVDTVAIDPNAAFVGQGAFVLSGTASSTVGVRSVEISARVGGAEKDLGAATLNTDGTWTFLDHVGRSVQGFVTATVTDDAGGTASDTPAMSLEAGIRAQGYVARQDFYTPDDAGYLANVLEHPDLSRSVEVRQSGQTFASQYYDTFDNGGAGATTFEFSPGYQYDQITGFRAAGPNHDTIALPSSDFATFADVLRHTQDTAAGAVIHDPASGDALLIAGLGKPQLAHYRADIAFHA